MNQLVEPGDYVKVTVQNQSYYILIDKIISGYVYSGQYIIYVVNNEWKVINYNVPHIVEFIPRPEKYGFTEIYDTDSNILMWLDYKSLLLVMSVNKFLNSINKDNHFWKRKVDLDYGVSEYKPTNETYKQQYHTLFWTKTPNQAIDENRMDSLIYYENMNNLPDINGANIAAENGNMEMILWLEKRSIFPDEYGLSLALGNGKTNVVDYGLNKNIFPERRGLNIATQSGDVELMKYCIHLGLFPSISQVNIAAGYGHIELLQLLQLYNILPDKTGLDRSLFSGHLEVAKWINNVGINPDKISIKNTIHGLNYNCIKWLIEDFNLLPEQEEVDFVCSKSIMSISRLLGKYKLYPSTTGLNNYCANKNNNRLDILEWMKMRGKYPNKGGVNKATKYGNINILQWLLNNGLFPNQKPLEHLMRCGKFDKLDMLLQYGIIPNIYIYKMYVKKIGSPQLQWLINNRLI